MTEISRDFLFAQIERFAISGVLKDAPPYGSGHINDTFAAVFTLFNGASRRYIVQRINKAVFHHPDQVMENISGVTNYLGSRIAALGGDPLRETLTLIPTKDGKSFHTDENGDYWRAYVFVEDTITYQTAETPALFAASAAAFGRFQMLLAEYPAATLHETIPDFHNTPARIQQFRSAMQVNHQNRAAAVAREIDFVLEREDFSRTLTDLLYKGDLPLRVTHNDTKLNNVLIDAATGKGLCVIDLDTVMPGLFCYDFGDSIRFGASTALEDEPDLDKVHFSLPLFEAYAQAYLSVAGKVLTEAERYHLPTGAMMMTLECGSRFLADHLNGDIYFKVHRPNHNLDRARTQFRLVEEMEKALPIMRDIVHAL